VALTVALTACGGGGSSTPTSPSPTPNLPAGGACGAIGTAIINGSDCTNTASVVLINLRDKDGPLGACSGTIIAARAVLTAAHCLVGGVTTAQIFLGTGPQIVASSFAAYPGYQEGDPNGLDVGVIKFDQDIGRLPIPVLLSRDARVGETAVIAGWGRNQNLEAATLRAGATTISAVGATQLQTQFSSTAASICSGDSGGPLLLNEGGTWGVAGINSAVTTGACNTGTAFYTNLRNANISAFILAQVPDARRN
jgi:V8-like Glu-specific endopeptidase